MVSPGPGWSRYRATPYQVRHRQTTGLTTSAAAPNPRFGSISVDSPQRPIPRSMPPSEERARRSSPTRSGEPGRVARSPRHAVAWNVLRYLWGADGGRPASRHPKSGGRVAWPPTAAMGCRRGRNWRAAVRGTRDGIIHRVPAPRVVHPKPGFPRTGGLSRPQSPA